MVGSLLSASAVSLGVVTASSSILTEVIGVGERTTSVMVREPVTVMTFISSALPPLPGLAPAAWDQAVADPKDAETASAISDAR
jgi:hypothetical protein